jgi:hypothetical protein
MQIEYAHNSVCSQARIKFKSPTSKAKRKPGGWEEKIHISDDFDAPLPDSIQSAFEGRVYEGLTLVTHYRKLEAYEVPILSTW